MNNKIEGKAVVITGASSGLSEATARFFSARGQSLCLVPVVSSPEWRQGTPARHGRQRSSTVGQIAVALSRQ